MLDIFWLDTCHTLHDYIIPSFHGWLQDDDAFFWLKMSASISCTLAAFCGSGGSGKVRGVGRVRKFFLVFMFITTPMISLFKEKSVMDRLSAWHCHYLRWSPLIKIRTFCQVRGGGAAFPLVPNKFLSPLVLIWIICRYTSMSLIFTK